MRFLNRISNIAFMMKTPGKNSKFLFYQIPVSLFLMLAKTNVGATKTTPH